LVVATPQAEARVLGTEFTIVTTTNSTSLSVTHGKVQMTQSVDGRKVIVPASHYVRVPVGQFLAALPLTGGILREYWTNVADVYDASQLRLNPAFPEHPAGRELLRDFEGLSHVGGNCGARYRGYLHPPSTGQYIFWVSAGDGAELYLSQDNNAAHSQQIAYAYQTGLREWERHRGQRSTVLTLDAGRRYYIEALHKQSTNGDHLAVAWKGPERQQEVIPGAFLEPFRP